MESGSYRKEDIPKLGHGELHFTRQYAQSSHQPWGKRRPIGVKARMGIAELNGDIATVSGTA
jgi:hypothetical protein